MKRTLGLDLGTTSIGWALVNEAENDQERASIVALGSRVTPLSVSESMNFEGGKSITTNADRRAKRGMRRNLRRYKMRRMALIDILTENGVITNDTLLSEDGKDTTHHMINLRAKAASEAVALEDFARVLLMINKKRGYKSGRKVDSQEEGQIIDGMEVAKHLYSSGITPGEMIYAQLQEGKKSSPEFYRSDLEAELDAIWECQREFHPEILTDQLRELIRGRGKRDTSALFLARYGLYTAENKGENKEIDKRADKKLEAYRWRVDGLTQELTPEQVAFVVSDLNGQLGGSSGYLSAIGDRSKELYFNDQTVGQYQAEQIAANPHTSLIGQVFYRQDYIDEFDRIWSVQEKQHKALTKELKKEIRDVVIFYQRRLKSQKGLISLCELESREIQIPDGKGGKKRKRVGARVCPKSSPLFQEFRIWQRLNDVELIRVPDEATGKRALTQEEKQILFEQLNVVDKLTAKGAIELLFGAKSGVEMNFKELIGNRTMANLIKVYGAIIEHSGHGEHNLSKMPAAKSLETIEQVFQALGYSTDILRFNPESELDELDKQPLYRLWHLLYSFEGDDSVVGDASLLATLEQRYGFEKEHARMVANVGMESDYGSLSAKAMRRILPYMKRGEQYDKACVSAGYRHSKSSLTKEEIQTKEYDDFLEILPKNSLRNPVVEKILNQMVHVVNMVIESYGAVDSIKIELARELKSSAKEREEATQGIRKATREHEEIREMLKLDLDAQFISRNDIIRYKLYKELSTNGYKALYSNREIKREELFSSNITIEHIIPQALLFDDSFSNKTLEFQDVNRRKGSKMAYDFVASEYGETEAQQYLGRIEELRSKKQISEAKHKKLKMKRSEIPEDFIQRDLRDTQYIAKKAKEMLEKVVPEVVSTSGSITAELRNDWQLVDVIKELNWNIYKQLEMTEEVKNRKGNERRQIVEWSKRDDHRHHALDALVVAFTKRSHIQYLNTLNAMSEEQKRSYREREMTKKKLGEERDNYQFNPPIPLNDLRAEAKAALKGVLVSFKAKGRVATIDRRQKQAPGTAPSLTPRGSLHEETVYGSILRHETEQRRVGSDFNEEKIATVAKKRYREALLERLTAFNGDAKKAFTGRNNLAKNPIYLDTEQSVSVPERVKLTTLKRTHTIRKAITPDLKVDKVIDGRVRRILEQRLAESDWDTKVAFSNLDRDPIWVDDEKDDKKKIAIKRVTIEVGGNLQPLRYKRDKNGEFLLDDSGNRAPNDYVFTGNNHHVAIYRDAHGKLQESIVSFFEATETVRIGLPIVNREHKQSEGWQFLFTMKQNEYFIFPDQKSGFFPDKLTEEELKSPENHTLISPNLYRVQALSSKYYNFRHHLDTQVKERAELRDILWRRVQSLAGLEGIVKVRLDHLGQIVEVGESVLV